MTSELHTSVDDPFTWHKRPIGSPNAGPCQALRMPAAKHTEGYGLPSAGTAAKPGPLRHPPSDRPRLRATGRLSVGGGRNPESRSPIRPQRPKPHLWHIRPKGDKGACSLCGCPAEGTRDRNQLHRTNRRRTNPVSFVALSLDRKFYLPVGEPIVQTFVSASADTADAQDAEAITVLAGLLSTGRRGPPDRATRS